MNSVPGIIPTTELIFSYLSCTLGYWVLENNKDWGVGISYLHSFVTV